MFNWLKDLFTDGSARNARPATNRPQLRLECLEDRTVPALFTFHGGPELPSVEVQPIFFGGGWKAIPNGPAESAYLTRFVDSLVQSSYMDMLKKAGYGVGVGRATSPYFTGAVSASLNTRLVDNQAQTFLQQLIMAKAVPTPDANRLYVIFVQPDEPITNARGFTSDALDPVDITTGYHWSFNGVDASGNRADIHYAVIPVPTKSVNYTWLQPLEQVTIATSHEIAEAVTDPDYVYYNPLISSPLLGWTDPTGGEIGDQFNGDGVYLNGYLVQRLADQNGLPMTPAGAAPLNNVSFVLYNNGVLQEVNSVGQATTIATNVSYLSDQSIDLRGFAMIDYISGGAAYEYHDVLGVHPIPFVTKDFGKYGITKAVAGQAVSYVLYADGNLFEYRDAQGDSASGATGLSFSTATNVLDVDAGTDGHGVNMVDVILKPGGVLPAISIADRLQQEIIQAAADALGVGQPAWEISDSTGRQFIAGEVAQVSAGQRGESAVLLVGGKASGFNDATGSLTSLGASVSMVSAGTDQNGNSILLTLGTNGKVQAFDPALPPQQLPALTGVTSIGKDHNGTFKWITQISPSPFNLPIELAWEWTGSPNATFLGAFVSTAV
jgi:hypothetical protein